MQTTLTPGLRDTAAGREAQAVIGKCVHCGFCLATCPTYQVRGDELDSPRGRIYLIKQVLEGRAPTATTQLHLDRCLTCRACETTCPSGVEYHTLLDTGRALVAAKVRRPPLERLRRFALREVLPRRWLFEPLAALGRLFAWLLPAALRRQLIAPSPPRRRGPSSAELDSRLRGNDRKVLLLQGCVQPALRPNINAATARVLGRLGIAAIEAPGAGCCGALRQHLDAHAAARDDMHRLIDAWWPHVEGGVEAIVITASGCGTQVKDLGRLLQGDPAYADKARRVAQLARDLAEFIGAQDDVSALRGGPPPGGAVAFHAPCTLQHGQRITGVVEQLLQAAGYALTPVPDSHLCCGSAGTYSILQPALAGKLRRRKLEALASGRPASIATANIGCLTHLAAGSEVPVRHWIELLDDRLQ